MEMMTILNDKQQDLSKEVENCSRLERRCSDLEKRVVKMAALEQELAEMTTKYAKTMEKLSSCQQALEELGGHLSESKLKIIELREEIQPLNEAAWVKDADVKDCKLCESPFSVTQRRHHCRNCGCIFCHNCSAARVKLPSSAKPVRVCLQCYEVLSSRNRTDSTSS
uniref:FYVE-type domain-containing protein n=1 Tax=Ditylenchus dipsaci TaxID=166011 RepID=A0A915DBE4_9BILA